MFYLKRFFSGYTAGEKLLSLFILLLFFSSLYFVHNNFFLYKQTIAEVKESHITETTEIVDTYQNEDKLFLQQLQVSIKNGSEKGEIITLENSYSASQVYDSEYKPGQHLFISTEINENGQINGTILDVKRDQYLVLAGWVFVIILLLVGRKQGFFSILSLLINAWLLSYALDLYLKNANWSLLLICSISVILFTVSSLLIVNGANEKTYAAIAATLLGTFLSLLITVLVFWVTAERGLRYEELQFITRPYREVFLAGLFLGSLGAVMDVAITLSSSLFSMYEKNHHISVKTLKKSGLEIGRDIMGTMTNILFFAYISGSIPILILYFKNASPLGYTLSLNLSLEMARALAGGIGIVLTIPIGLYTAIFFINRKRLKT
ncbi:YibE/F family protein [Bacillus lacus]|uniref:YibE/F family protein n=1 Tax=Metabacillus lacus TaxID=1983721 RepID=A0A7X2IY34_9BACI|nr:YibE/F family protein [Metabacillus lacus]MRX71928.1 YibE/F family protein [Metabacillus lacus]